ncbi:MAG TPA: hypothetical protein VFC51_02130 [Chloroflexota bacterium]|nr:hypothetical protein [Chloroflexota bacterium]
MPTIGERQRITGLDRWAAWLGATVSGASLTLVLVADFGWFGPLLAGAAVSIVAVATALWWRPPIDPRGFRPGHDAAIAAAILAVGCALIAPGSENIVGPRDPAVYVATGFAISRWGGTTIHDPALAELASGLRPTEVNDWFFENVLNHARIRFPTQLFIRDLDGGTVEGGFLPVLPVWIALAASVAGVEGALHVSGAFGALALAYAMLAAAATCGRRTDPRPSWAIVGVLLATSFAQVWWAREPMAEPVLGAFTWISAWSVIRWRTEGSSRWAGLAALSAAAALLARADGVLLVLAVGLLAQGSPNDGRRWLALIGGAGLVAAIAHYALVAPIYVATTYSGFTATRGAIGIAAAAGLVAAIVATRSAGWRLRDLPSRHARAWLGARRGVALAVAVVGLGAALIGVAPNAGRDPTEGAGSPIAWVAGYVPWPILVLTAIGLAVTGWRGAPRQLMPVLIIAGLPALLYLPDPLVTGDHPWMVRRLVPAVVPLIAMLASVGATALWRAPGWSDAAAGSSSPETGGALVGSANRQPRALAAVAREWWTGARVLGCPLAAILFGLGVAMGVVQDRDFVGPRHASGTIAALDAIARAVEPGAVVVFSAGPTGIHAALPLDLDLGVDAFALPTGALTPAISASMARLAANGRPIYWVQEGGITPTLPPGVTAARVAEFHLRYRSADNGPVPPPLRFKRVDDLVVLDRLVFRD